MEGSMEMLSPSSDYTDYYYTAHLRLVTVLILPSGSAVVGVLVGERNIQLEEGYMGVLERRYCRIQHCDRTGTEGFASRHRYY